MKRLLGHLLRARRRVRSVLGRRGGNGQAGADLNPGSEARDLIDVRALMKTYTLEDLNASAEQYFARLRDTRYLLAKPFASPEEAPGLMIQFGQLLQGLQLAPGHAVLDFGAGSITTTCGWS